MEDQGDSGKLKWTPFLQNMDTPSFEDNLSEQSAAFAIEENFVLSENKNQMVAAILGKYEPMVVSILEKYKSMVEATLEKYESKDEECAALEKEISALKIEIKKQAQNFKWEQASLRELLGSEEASKKSLLDENLDLKASGEAARVKISESANLNAQLAEKIADLEKKLQNSLGEAEVAAQEKNAAISESANLNSKLAEKKADFERELEKLRMEVEAATREKNAAISENEQLRIESVPMEAVPLEESKEGREESPERLLSPSIDFSMEPEWMRALANLKDPIASASARVKQLAAVRLPEGPRAILGLAIGSLAQASDTLRVIGEFLNESPPPRTPENLEAALNASAGIWEGLFRRKRILISRGIPAGLPAVSIASTSLHTVFYQIFRNAFEAMPKGGTLKITAGEEPENGQVKIVFADTGPGFSDVALEKIFIPFTFSRQGHLGLGLSLARRILRRAAGDIEVENLKPQGAAVILRFPGAGQIPIPPLNPGDQ